MTIALTLRCSARYCRGGKRADSATGWPYEVWVRKPRMELVLVSAGEFTMGSPDTITGRDPDEGPQHRVRIVKPFYLCKYELTQSQWREVMAAVPWAGRTYFCSLRHPIPVKCPVPDDPRHPAVYVSWDDCQEFLAKLNRMTGASGFRLPTEAEWEYASRAGSTGQFCFGDDQAQLGAYAWYRDNAWVPGKRYGHPVGTKRPNPWGLYDMHGNVWEWCQDRYSSAYYRVSPRDDPAGAATGATHTDRGGCYWSQAQACSSTNRFNLPSSGHDARNPFLGVRPALSVPPCSES